MSQNLINEYLQKYQDLSAVEVFAMKKDFKQIQAMGFYEELIPKSAPGPRRGFPGAQSASLVDGDGKCHAGGSGRFIRKRPVNNFLEGRNKKSKEVSQTVMIETSAKAAVG